MNNFIVRNGSDSSTFGGVAVVNSVAATQVFDFNTVAGNRVGVLGTATNFNCGVTTPFTASGNILYQGLTEGVQPTLVSTNCDFAYSILEGITPATTNIDQDPLFVNPVAGAASNYHLMTGSPGINAADENATLDVDIDGEERPQGGRHDMGADEAE